MRDVAVIGAGIAGLSTAARLQARHLTTIVLESHGQPGGCAGFFRRKGFSFDVGATTLVDFEAGGVGGELLESVGMPPLDGEQQTGYVHSAIRRNTRVFGGCWTNLRVCSGGPAGLESSCRSCPGWTPSAPGG